MDLKIASLDQKFCLWYKLRVIAHKINQSKHHQRSLMFMTTWSHLTNQSLINPWFSNKPKDNLHRLHVPMFPAKMTVWFLKVWSKIDNAMENTKNKKWASTKVWRSNAPNKRPIHTQHFKHLIMTHVSKCQSSSRAHIRLSKVNKSLTVLKSNHLKLHVPYKMIKHTRQA